MKEGNLINACNFAICRVTSSEVRVPQVDALLQPRFPMGSDKGDFILLRETTR